MQLLEYERMFERFNCKECKQKITIIMYSKSKEELNVLSKEKDEIHNYLKSMNANGAVGEIFYYEGKILVSVGDLSKDSIVKRTNVKKAMKSVYNTLKRFNKSEIVFEDNDNVEDAIYGLIMTSYSYDFLKKEKDNSTFFLNMPKYEKIIRISHAQNFSRFLGDTPANYMTPTLFVAYAEKFFSGSNVEFIAYDKEYMLSNNMNLILSVSQGSAQEPKLLHIRYNGGSTKEVDLAMVGKGVCFDTGGISIKPSANMYRMRHDMFGAATLLATMKLIVDMNLKINVTLTCPMVENMPGSKATKPGDVFVSMSGKTVEVDNTDAEGRLILSDAITFAQKDHPKFMIDAATLTGAMCVALGNVYGGYFTNDDNFSNLIYDSGVKTNDLLWRMPLSPYYRETLKSHVADMNNMGGAGAGSAKAAEFLHEFVDKEVKWAHFDIAGISDGAYNSEIFGSEVSGRPVPAFIEIAERLASIKN